MKIYEAIFIDRDGTIGGGSMVQYPDEFELYPFSFDCIRRLKREGIPVFAFTNQPGIARGEEAEATFEQELLSFGFDGVYLCPHAPEQGCQCRKPAVGLLARAAKEHHLNLKNCVVIGDRWSDMVAASHAGCSSILVQTGAGEEALGKYKVKWIGIEPDYIATNLVDAVQWILNK